MVRRGRAGAWHRRARSRDRRDQSHAADAVVLATGGYGNVFYLSTNAKGCNVTATWRAYKRGAGFANPCFTQIHPDVHPGIRRVSIEAHADERVAAQRRPRLGAQGEGDARAPSADPGGRARLLSRAEVPELRQSLAARHRVACREGSVRRGTRRGARRSRRVSRFRRCDQAAGQGGDRGTVRQPVRDVRADHRRESVHACRCASIRRCTTRWAGCGSTTT